MAADQACTDYVAVPMTVAQCRQCHGVLRVRWSAYRRNEAWLSCEHGCTVGRGRRRRETRVTLRRMPWLREAALELLRRGAMECWSIRLTGLLRRAGYASKGGVSAEGCRLVRRTPADYARLYAAVQAHLATAAHAAKGGSA